MLSPQTIKAIQEEAEKLYPLFLEVNDEDEACNKCSRLRRQAYVKAATLYAEQLEEVRKERERLLEILKRMVQAGAIGQHTKDYTWIEFCKANNL